jgi:hypothetical protein
MTTPRQPARARAEAAVRAWVASSGVPVQDGARAGELVVELPGQAKLRTTVSLLVGERGLRALAFVVRHPDENHEAFYRWLLGRNLRLPGIAFGTDHLGDVYLSGRLRIEAVSEDAVDELLGAMLAAADSSFNDLLVLGFLTSMRREWRWRTDRGESTANLEAFRSLLAVGDGDAEPPAR